MHPGEAGAPLATLTSRGSAGEGNKATLTVEELFPSLPDLSRDVLADQGIINPSPIQAAAAASLSAGRSVVLRSETGSGKTLAFLLPALVRLQQAADEAMVLVIAPTRELAVQIMGGTEAHLPGSTALMTLAAQPSTETIVNAKFLVVTPKQLSTFCDEHDEESIRNLLGRVEVCILDEFDELIPKVDYSGKVRFRYQDDGMSFTEGLLNRLLRNNDSPSLQVIALSATAFQASRIKLNDVLSKDPWNRFKRRLKVIEPRVPKSHFASDDDGSAAGIMANDEEGAKTGFGTDAKQWKHQRYPSLPPGIQHLFWTLKPSGDHSRALVGALEKVQPRSAVVFVCPNAGESVSRVVEELFKAGWTGAVQLTKQMFPDTRHGAGYHGKKRRPVAAESKAWRSIVRLEEMRDTMRLGYEIDIHEAPIVVTAEECVRGLDLAAVEAVFVLGLPKSGASYVHMAGRTGRLPHPFGYSVLVAKNRELNKIIAFYAGETGLNPRKWVQVNGADGRVPPLPGKPRKQELPSPRAKASKSQKQRVTRAAQKAARATGGEEVDAVEEQQARWAEEEDEEDDIDHMRWQSGRSAAAQRLDDALWR